MSKKRFIFCLLFICFFSSIQFFYSQSFEKILSKYEKIEENNSKALPYVGQYINKAKKERNFQELALGYKDAVFYSPNSSLKIKYADSCVASAIKSENNDLIATVFVLKGSIYYYNYKSYKLALEEYLKAYQYSKNSKDGYLSNKVIYHIGVVKSYLGYYYEALEHFKNCTNYFESNIKSKPHPDDIFNNTKGYLNSIHQTIVCYRNLGDFKIADSLIKVGLNIAGNSKDFALERGYFLKCRGILNYHEEKYNEAITDIDKALPQIKKKKDFAWTSVSYFYKGKSYLALGDKKKAVSNFLKVDSIFQKNKFILPELRENYELLINNAKENEDTKRELYYTKSLLKADSVINKDFTYLSSRIHKEYDTQSIVDSKNNLEHQNSWGRIFIVALIVAVLVLVSLLYYRNQKEKEIRFKYSELEKRLQQGVYIVPVVQENKENKENVSKLTLSDEIVNEILEKLVNFETKNKFTEKGMTLNKLAKKLKTNANYLSQVINDKRGMNFTKYLAELRINYITQKIYFEKKYLNYTVEGLADECGIASRQNFSDLFFSINGIRPADFIKQRKKVLEKQGKSTSQDQEPS